MPTNALDNPLVLPILGLLVEQPRHAYGLFNELRHRYDYMPVRNATVYTLLARLSEAGWIESNAASEPTTFAPTGAGISALAERVAHQIRESDLTGGPTFAAALAYIGILHPSTATAVLRERAQKIRTERARLEQAIQDAGQHEVHMIEVHYLASHLAHDLDWLDTTIHRIRTGDLSWPHQDGRTAIQ